MQERTHARGQSTPTLDIANLTVAFKRRRDVVTAVDGISMQIWPGEIVGVIGESGSGKSMTALSVMRLLPRGASTQGTVHLAGDNLSEMSERQMQSVRGNRVAMIPQDALQSLNPTLRVGFQVGEPMRLHQQIPSVGLKQRVIDLMKSVHIPRAKQSLRAWPHQFSGGMQQRAMIATGLALQPQLIIADEPTTALDVTVQAEILDLLRDIRDRYAPSMLFITHDLGVVAELCDYVYVMNKGRLVEHGNVEKVLTSPEDPYTRMLLDATPSIDGPRSAT